MSHLDGLALAEKIRSSEVTTTELIEEAFKKIKSENPTLNFVTSTRFSKAIEEGQIRDFSTLLFGGVPILIKGLGQELAGEPSTAGAKLLRNNSALTTNYFVAALEKAGFIVIGQTNTLEFGFKNITDPGLYGPTSNPWNPDYSAGGSSSGAAISFALMTFIRDTAAMLDSLQVIEPSAAFQASLYKPRHLTSLGTLSKKIQNRLFFSFPSSHSSEHCRQKCSVRSCDFS